MNKKLVIAILSVAVPIAVVFVKQLLEEYTKEEV